MKRFYVLDALRSVLALWVAIGHAGVFPLFGAEGQNDWLLDLIARGVRSLVWGPPAVIVFFVISGFCIHYPFAASGKRCQTLRFYARRYLRILIPVAFTVAMFKLMFPQTVIVGADSILWHSTLWSIVCEEAFYALYPFLNRLSFSFGLAAILRPTIAAALLVAWLSYPAEEWQDLGILGTAVVLFPVWLLGCGLAERVSSIKQVCSQRAIWGWRLSAWAVMWMAEMLHFHGGIPQTRTSLWTGIFFYFWVRAEIGYYRGRAPWAVLVWAGRWSYSLYLVHPLVIALCFKHGFLIESSPANFVAMMVLILTGAYVFYLLVERPSHNCARRIALFAPDEPRYAGAAEQTAGAIFQSMEETGAWAHMNLHRFDPGQGPRTSD